MDGCEGVVYFKEWSLGSEIKNIKQSAIVFDERAMLVSENLGRGQSNCISIIRISITCTAYIPHK